MGAIFAAIISGALTWTLYTILGPVGAILGIGLAYPIGVIIAKLEN